MAKNITIAGSDYPNVPAVKLTQTGGGDALFLDADEFQKKSDSGLSTSAKTVVGGINELDAEVAGKYTAGNALAIGANFSAASDGKLTATNVTEVSGHIGMNSGNIAGFILYPYTGTSDCYIAYYDSTSKRGVGVAPRAVIEGTDEGTAIAVGSMPNGPTAGWEDPEFRVAGSGAVVCKKLRIREISETDNMADYVIDQPTVTGGWYRKWASGKLECWIKKTVSISGSAAWGSFYYFSPGASDRYVDYSSVPFTDVPCVTVSLDTTSDGAFLFSSGSATATHSANYYYARPDNSGFSGKTYTLNLYAVGKWK